MYNIHAGIDGVDQAPLAHGGDHGDLIDRAAQRGAGGRGRPDGPGGA